MDRRPRVAWDLDDLFHPFIQAVVATINREMGTSYDWRTLPDYEFDVVYGLDSATATRFVNETLAVDGPYHALPFSDEAKAVLRRLSEWIDLGLLTSRKEETLGNITREVIEREVPGVFRFIDLTGNMYAGGVYRQKVDVCRERDYNALVDDLLRHLMPVAADGRLGICFGEYGWNHLRDSAGELLPLPEGIVRAYTFSDVERVLQRYFDSSDCTLALGRR